MRGETHVGVEIFRACLISIHSPRAGRDGDTTDFTVYNGTFQSTRPVRGETFDTVLVDYTNRFQSTRPVRGETGGTVRPPPKAPDFNPLAPCGARPDSQERHGTLKTISIHSPRAGRDETRAAPPPPRRHFNPLAPCGARRACTAQTTPRSLFQSTRPVRGETAKVYKLYCYGSYTSDKKTLFEALSPVCCMFVFWQQAGLPSAKHTGYFLSLPLRTDSYHQNVLRIIACLCTHVADFP